VTSPDYAARIARYQAAMDAAGIGALFLNYGPDIYYLTGIEKPVSYDVGRQVGDWITGLVLTAAGDRTLIHKPIWMKEFGDDLPFEVRSLEGDEDDDAFLARQLNDLGLDGKTLGVTKTLWAQSLLSVQRALPNASVVPLTDGFIDKVREIKDAHEIALLEEAARITDATYAAVIKQMKPGMLDRDLVIEIDYQFKLHGGDDFSFHPTVVLDGHGTRTARNWTDRRPPEPITNGMSVAFDMGVVYKGYCSDFGRSVFVGEWPDEPLRAWQSITRVIQAAMAEMGDGQITPAGVHDFVVDEVTKDGFRDQFSWDALGHGIGLNVHEDPWMLPRFTEPVREGMCFALEPKIGRPGSFYVRCEDVVVVEQGRARSLTLTPYEPVVIG
jgi:Xaa-Pro aminopeptidase